MRLADFTSVIFSFGRWYGVLLSCTAANNFSIPNAPAVPAPARKKDLLFNEPIPCLLEGSHNFTKKGLPCPKEADRKSTRLNSSHLGISYAVFCLKTKRPDA